MDIAKIREDFPITRDGRIYLDNASLSPYPTPVVAAATLAYQQRSQTGVDSYWRWIEIADETRSQCAQLINADADEIALVENTSTGINIVANGLDWKAGDNVVVNDLEFFPNLYPWLRQKKQHGIQVRIIHSQKPDGTQDVTLEDLRAACDERTRVIALSQVAWINGLKHDLVAIGDLAHSRGAYLLVDAIQSVGALQFDVHQGPVDFVACGGHKWLLGPLGTGFFYCRRELIERFEPVYVSWHSDVGRYDYRFREEYVLDPTAKRFMPANINMTGVLGLHAGTRYLLDLGMAEIERRNMMLSNRLVAGLHALGLKFLSPLRPEARSQIVNFVPADLERTLKALAKARVEVSTRNGGVRVSPNFYNEEWEIDRLVEVVAGVERG
jgi:cysteine desulfurase/selenocysteine lyase